MLLENTIDMDVPVEHAFKKFTDLELLTENMPSNVIFRSTSGDSTFTLGSAWRAQITRARSQFNIEINVIEYIENEKIVFESSSNRIFSDTTLTFTATTKTSCSLEIASTLAPKGILGRILIQSLKASQRRVNTRIARFGDLVKAKIESSYSA